MNNRIIISNLNSVKHFIEEKNDISRWVYWDDEKENILKQFPELKIALDAQITADMLMELALSKISDEICKLEDEECDYD